ncbi:ABC transporter permease [bacterium]|nr:ABC transporter permease [bacterium]
MRKDGEILIRPGGTAERYWSEIWAYRELFAFFAWRDVTVRYKQTFLGICWALIQPIVTMVVFTLVFGRLAKMPAEGLPYPILVYAGVLPWQFFSTALSGCSGSLVSNANLLRKIYFPRLIIPVSSTVVALVDFAIAFVLLGVLMGWYGIMPGPEIVALPIFLLGAMLTSIAAGIWFAALNVKFRDFRFVVPFVIQLGVYLSPVGFPSSAIPDRYRFLYGMNPMVGVIDGFRWCLLGGKISVNWGAFGCSMLLVLILLALGIRHFRRVENSFADVV